MNRILITLTVASALALGACKREPPESTPPLPQDTATDTGAGTDTGMNNGGMMGGPGSQSHFAQVMAGADTILFETDRYNIDSQDGVALRRQAEYLLQYPDARATVEGHADERGTREYNLALGARRAAATRDYLAQRGVPAQRLKTISYGKERPVAVCDDISCWSQNRRAVTVLGGAGM